jgi:hypothetical protein
VTSYFVNTYETQTSAKVDASTTKPREKVRAPKQSAVPYVTLDGSSRAKSLMNVFIV